MVNEQVGTIVPSVDSPQIKKMGEIVGKMGNEGSKKKGEWEGDVDEMDEDQINEPKKPTLSTQFLSL